jgi:hypothetical protein
MRIRYWLIMGLWLYSILFVIRHYENQVHEIKITMGEKACAAPKICIDARLKLNRNEALIVCGKPIEEY